MAKMEIVNGSDREFKRQRFVLAFGQISTLFLMVWADHLDGALDESVDWLVDNAPGLLCDAEVQEAYNEAIQAGKSEEEAQEEAEVDTTCAGNEGHYLRSDDWNIVFENPTRQQIKEFQARL